MEKGKVLNEVNRLVAAGLRKSAIEIIQEYLEKTPNDSAILNALGRIYLLEQKPDQAVKYLQLSLKYSHSEINHKGSTEAYDLDDLTADDLAYIDDTATFSSDDTVYTSKNTTSMEVDTIPKQITSLVTPNSQLNRAIPDQKNSDKPRPISSEALLTDLKSADSHPGSIDNDSGRKRNSIADFNESVHTNKVDYSSRSGDLFTTNTTSIAFSENEQSDLFSDEEEISIDDYIHDDFETEGEEDAFIIPEIEDVITETEFSWDDLDEFDELDEQDTIDTFAYHILTEGKLNRSERARQIATEIVKTYEWGKENLPLLQQVFMENGWSAARVSIEREINKGLLPEELQLALVIRQLWTDNQQYWISFIHVTSNQDGQQTRAAYKNMSWPESLRIIRSFNNTPSEEEIQLFLEQIYDDWYCSQKLQRQYKAFIRYLKYRTGSVRGSLPGKELFSFLETYANYENESFLDNGYNFIKQAVGVENLRQEGIDIEQMLVGIEQKYAVTSARV
jgi:tetratricopeptide (TPR) repeat protein